MDPRNLLALALLGPLAAQAPFTAQWTALAPIVAQWTNAPAGTPNAIATFPAGPLPNATTTVGVTVGTWTNVNWFQCGPLALEPGMVTNWSFTAHAFAPWGQISQTAADLLLHVTGPHGTTGTVDCEVTSSGDSVGSWGFRVDIGNDGSIEIDSAPTMNSATHLQRRAGYAWNFAAGPLLVRVRHANTGWYAPQVFGLTIAFRPWVAAADSAGDDCGNQGMHSLFAGYATHYHLAALPPLAPTDLAALRATGLGPFSAFLISTQPTTVTYQLAGLSSSPCDLLANVAFTATGGVTRTLQYQSLVIPAEWVVPVPALPPGLVFSVQHASMMLPWLGFTNRVRIRT